jgi:hypothetical protein
VVDSSSYLGLTLPDPFPGEIFSGFTLVALSKSQDATLIILSSSCIEDVDSFIYLGSIVAKDGGVAQDVLQRI